MDTPETVVPERFHRGGFDHCQLKRNERAAIYRRTKGKTAHFEVIRIRRLPVREIQGVTLPAGESYPGSEKWGCLGWTYTEIEGAEARFATL